MGVLRFHAREGKLLACIWVNVEIYVLHALLFLVAFCHGCKQWCGAKQAAKQRLAAPAQMCALGKP
jgi:hypothetical protein